MAELFDRCLSGELAHELHSASEDRPWALVLGGGGARGAYEVGVLKAVHDLGMTVGGVYGTSIGAINALFVASRKIDELVRIWLSIKYSDVFRLPETVMQDLLGEGNGITSMRQLVRFQSFLIRNRGLDNSPLAGMLTREISEKEVRESGIDLGLVTYNMSRMKPVEQYIEQIPEGELHDYALASSNLPIFKTKRIGQNIYTDGGVYNNLPSDMALARGFKRLIVVDIHGLGRRPRVRFENCEVIYLKPEDSIGSMVFFNGKTIENNIARGYCDLLSTVTELEGSRGFYRMPGECREWGQGFIELYEFYAKSVRAHLDDKAALPQNGDMRCRQDGDRGFRLLAKTIRFTGSTDVEMTTPGKLAEKIASFWQSCVLDNSLGLGKVTQADFPKLTDRFITKRINQQGGDAEVAALFFRTLVEFDGHPHLQRLFLTLFRAMPVVADYIEAYAVARSAFEIVTGRQS